MAFAVLIFIVSETILLGSDQKYNVGTIPAEIRNNAMIVVRKNDISFRITAVDKAVMSVTRAYTIMNENGLVYSKIAEFYDKFSSVRNMSVKLYDKNGDLIRNGADLNEKDYSAIDEYSIFEDSRMKYVDPKYRTTPFTIEVTYEIAYDGLLNYPSWIVYNDFNVGVENSTLTVTVPSDFKFRYKETNLTEPGNISQVKETKVFKWQVHNLPAVKKEPFCLGISELSPAVHLAPDNFRISEADGNLESWKGFGLWLSKIGEKRDVLEPETVEKIKTLVYGASNEEEKVKLIYNYFQNKVRYVSIQIGLGGWQPIEASKVDRLSYGDCKALSNYLKALLEATGIKSFYTIIKAGNDSPDIMQDFPSNQFNHAILCVPVNGDTIWLECTSQRIPFGYLGTFTDDRHALLAGESGGVLVKTREYKIQDNIQSRNVTAKINPEGTADIKCKSLYKGLLYDDISSVLAMDEAHRKEFVQKSIKLPGFNLNGYKFAEEKSKIPVITEDLDILVPGYITSAGTSFLLNPNIMTRFTSVPFRSTDRKSKILIRRSFQECDTVEISLPATLIASKMPEPQVIKSPFGEYSSVFAFLDGKIKYVRVLKFFKGTFDRSDYNTFVDFCEKLSIYDQKALVLTKKQF